MLCGTPVNSRESPGLRMLCSGEFTGITGLSSDVALWGTLGMLYSGELLGHVLRGTHGMMYPRDLVGCCPPENSWDDVFRESLGMLYSADLLGCCMPGNSWGIVFRRTRGCSIAFVRLCATLRSHSCTCTPWHWYARGRLFLYTSAHVHFRACTHRHVCCISVTAQLCFNAVAPLLFCACTPLHYQHLHNRTTVRMYLSTSPQYHPCNRLCS